MTIPESLIRQLTAGRVVPFIGSGASLSVKPGLFPTWSQLLLRLADRLDRDAKPQPAQLVRLFVEMGRLNNAADEALKALGNADFARELREYFQANQPGDADLSLAAALWRLGPRLLVTTNYDDALRWSNAAAWATSPRRWRRCKTITKHWAIWRWPRSKARCTLCIAAATPTRRAPRPRFSA